MKPLTLTFLFAFISFNLQASDQKIVCLNSDSKLVLYPQSIGAAIQYSGFKYYNHYTSYANIDCALIPGKENTDTLDCSSDYGIIYSLFEIPKNVYSQNSEKLFSVTEHYRDENTGVVSSTINYINCKLSTDVDIK